MATIDEVRGAPGRDNESKSPRRRRGTLLAQDRRLGYGLIAPAIVLLLGITAYPLVYNIWNSFHYAVPAIPFINGKLAGLANFRRMFAAGSSFMPALLHTGRVHGRIGRHRGHHRPGAGARTEQAVPRPRPGARRRVHPVGGADRRLGRGVEGDVRPAAGLRGLRAAAAAPARRHHHLAGEHGHLVGGAVHRRRVEEHPVRRDHPDRRPAGDPRGDLRGGQDRRRPAPGGSSGA